MDEKRTRLLLLEDDLDDAVLLRDLLDEAAPGQFEIDHLTHLSAAVARTNQTHPDVVLCDLSVPGSQGLNTFLTLRDSTVSVPIVVLTGLDDETIAMRAVQEGAQDYLVKGHIDGPLLVRSLRYAIERQRVSDYRAVLLERQRFDTAIAQMSDGIVVTDEAWRIVSANRAACLLLNMGAETCIGGSLEGVLEAFELSPPLSTLRTSTEPSESFSIARPHTEPPLFIEARLDRLFDATGRLVSLVLALRDVTQERHNRQLRAGFFMMVSHKLRTPLTVLRACFDLCRRLPRDGAARQFTELMDICDAEVRRLQDMVEQLLDFKAVTSQEAEAAGARASIAMVVRRLGDTLRDGYPAKHIQIDTDIPSEATCVGCSPEQLAFILDKLLDNAVKFGDKEPVLVRVVSRPVEAGSVEITVTDNGPGIPHEYYDRVFQEFLQIEDLPTGQVPGLGIGLAMVRHVVEALGGSVSVESTLGEGSTFRVRLPAC
ncbi:MAG: ATP-binding protein [Candidatus Zipacnadales bacterium]